MSSPPLCYFRRPFPIRSFDELTAVKNRQYNLRLRNSDQPEKMNLLGAIVAVAIYASAILVFIFRLIGKPQHGHWVGYFEFLLAIPLLFLLLKAPQLKRTPLYYVQIGLMLAWLVVEALLDYILKVNFRNIRWMVISYVVLFFAGTGGMLGVASAAGRGWGIFAIILFLIMAVLAFVQRAVTGM